MAALSWLKESRRAKEWKAESNSLELQVLGQWTSMEADPSIIMGIRELLMLLKFRFSTSYTKTVGFFLPILKKKRYEEML